MIIGNSTLYHTRLATQGSKVQNLEPVEQAKTAPEGDARGEWRTLAVDEGIEERC